MTETILRDGEIAFLPDGTVIMNTNTAIDFANKVEANKNKKEQTNEEAMENAMLFLAALFGESILDKKPEAPAKPAAPVKPTRTAADSTHPKKSEQYWFPEVAVDELCGENSPGKRQFKDNVFVYVDNFGNVFGTLSEADFRHQMAAGTAAKIVKGKQRVGYAEGYREGYFNNYEREKICTLNDQSLYNTTANGKTDFDRAHLVYLVKVPKSAILPKQNFTDGYEYPSTRESRYRAWLNAMNEANKQLNAALTDPGFLRFFSGAYRGTTFEKWMNNHKNATKELKRVFGKSNMKNVPEYCTMC